MNYREVKALDTEFVEGSFLAKFPGGQIIRLEPYELPTEEEVYVPCDKNTSDAILMKFHNGDDSWKEWVRPIKIDSPTMKCETCGNLMQNYCPACDQYSKP